MPKTTEVKALGLSEAKSLYEEFIGEKAFLKNGETNSIQLTPNWEKGQLSSDSLWYVVESPLDFSAAKKILLMTEEVNTYTAQKQDPSLAKQLLRLVVMRNKKTGDTYSFIMHFVPGLDYLLQHGDHLDDNTYLSQSSDLDGSIFYYTPDGKFVNGWVYEKGKITASLVPDGSDTGLFETKAASYDCYGFVEEDRNGNVIGGGVICIKRIEISDVIMYMPGPILYYDFGTQIGGGGGGGGGGKKPQPEPEPEKEPEPDTTKVVRFLIDSITKKNSLDFLAKGQLDNILKEMLLKCGYKRMYDYAISRDASFSDISINSASTFLAGYFPKTKELVFKSRNLIQSSFPEEFIHFIQDAYYSGGIEQHQKSVNIEFEAKLLQDLLCMQGDETPGCGYFGATDETRYFYDQWLIALTANNAIMPNYDKLRERNPLWGNLNYWDFMAAFAKDPNRPNYAAPIDVNLLPLLINYINTGRCK